MELKIGKRIQDLRKQKGLTQEQVAAALNISAAAVSKWETDTTYPDITILNPLARLLGVSVDVLLDFQEQMTEEECMKRMEKADTLFSTRTGRGTDHPLIQTFDGTSGESRWDSLCQSSDAGDGLCCAGIY